MSALVVLSGGLDSTVALAEVIDQHDGRTDSIGAVTFTYGQKHKKEVLNASMIADHYELAYHKIIGLPEVFGGTESVLMEENNLEMPRASYEEINEADGVSPTYVPYRNGNLLSMAAAVALVEHADEVWAGMHAEDAHNWAYPDCTPEFLGAMAGAIYIGTYHKVRLITPHMWRTKSEVVAAGFTLDVPFELTWSCYDGREDACGTCPTCVGRIQAFIANNLCDPIKYEIDVNWETEYAI